MVSVNITDKCNQNCLYCEINKTESSETKESLNYEHLKWLIDEMHIQNMQRMSINGGEPFLFKDIFKLIQYAWEKGIRCNITSNGMLFPQLKETEIQILVKCQTLINISIDSFDNELHNYIRGNNQALEKVKKAIGILNKESIPLTMLTAVSRYNYKDLYNSMKIALDLGISQILYQPIIYSTNFPDKEALNDKSNINVPLSGLKDLKEQLLKIYQFEKKNRLSTNIYRILPWIQSYLESAHEKGASFFVDDVVNQFYCREIDAVIDISYYGDIQACGLIGGKRNIMDQDAGLMQMWQDSSEQLKQQLSQKQFPEICNACCHKASRNLIASCFKYPFQNRKLLFKYFQLFSERMYFRSLKKVKNL